MVRGYLGVTLSYGVRWCKLSNRRCLPRYLSDEGLKGIVIYQMKFWGVSLFIRWRFKGYRYLSDDGLRGIVIYQMMVWGVSLFIRWRFKGYRYLSDDGLRGIVIYQMKV